ncbi:penicillin-binding protein 1C [Roseibium litorale]|nr:penicillin-binding protein 1C [Roseibium litorale]
MKGKARDGRRASWRRRMRYAAGGSVLCLALAIGAGAKIAHDVSSLPPLAGASGITLSPVVLDRNDRLLRSFTSADDKWRLPVELSEVDPLYIRMLLAYEDGRFYEHHGVDPLAALRAAGQMLTSGKIVSGGSTLTMQVARLLREVSTRSLQAKYDQVITALKLEETFSKDEILHLYLLRAPFGGNLEGIRAASLVWFGKEPSRLTPAEAALLVALPQSPEARRPDRFNESARTARDRVLARAVGAGVISAEEAEAAQKDSVPTARRDMPFLAAHAARKAVLGNPGAAVHRLTLERDLQSTLETLVRRHVQTLGPHISAAVLVADHTTGEILASVGSPGLLDEARLGHVDMTEALRSPGSTLKPFIYGLAFEEGIAHPESFVDDRPIDIAGYRPTNFDMGYQGRVTVREALQMSLNTPAIQLLEAVGPSRLMARMKRAGVSPVLSGDKAPGLAIGLGGLGLSLKDLAALYAALAEGGRIRPLSLYRDAAGLPVRADLGGQDPLLPLLDPIAAWHVGDILTGLPHPWAAGSAKIAYKTGTSYGYRDAWAVGFDGRHVIAVWTGRADGTPVPGQTGAGSAAPLLFEAFQRLKGERQPLKDRPAGVLAMTTGELPIPLRHARVAQPESTAQSRPLKITYPPDGALVELGLGYGTAEQHTLIVKLEGGRRPYTWFVNGAPVETALFRKELVWTPDGEGFATVSVLDANGQASRIDISIK